MDFLICGVFEKIKAAVFCPPKEWHPDIGEIGGFRREPPWIEMRIDKIWWVFHRQKKPAPGQGEMRPAVWIILCNSTSQLFLFRPVGLWPAGRILFGKNAELSTTKVYKAYKDVCGHLQYALSCEVKINEESRSFRLYRGNWEKNSRAFTEKLGPVDKVKKKYLLYGKIYVIILP